MHVRLLAAFCACALLSAFPSIASADTVYSNLGPGDSFNTGSGTLIGSGSENELAAQFTVGPTAYTLSSADVALWGILAEDGPASVTLWDNVFVVGPGNSPGSVLATGSNVFAPLGGPALRTSTFGGSVTLAANTTYWLALSVPNGEELAWMWNNTGGTGAAVRAGGVSPWFNASNLSTSAFRINGAPQNGIHPVPTPTASAAGLALLASILAAHQLRRRGASQS